MQRIIRNVAHVQTGSELWCLVCLCSQFYSWSWLSSIAVLWFGLKVWFVSETEPRAHVNGICSLLRLSQIAVLPKEQLGATWNSAPSLPMKLFIPDDFSHGHVKCFLLTGSSSTWIQGSVFVNFDFLQKFQIYTNLEHPYAQEAGKFHLISNNRKRRKDKKGWEEYIWCWDHNLVQTSASQQSSLRN